MNEFSKLVYAAVKEIPAGRVMTYGQIARIAGNSRGARGVGFILHRNPDPDTIPCHRVVFKNGSLSPGYAFGGAEVQRHMLEAEGVRFLPDGRVDMRECAIDMYLYCL